MAPAVDVHVNHPRFDKNTPRVGAELYLACRCRWCFMSGTHRYANPNDESDMERATTSVFKRVRPARLATNAWISRRLVARSGPGWLPGADCYGLAALPVGNCTQTHERLPAGSGPWMTV